MSALLFIIACVIEIELVGGSWGEMTCGDLHFFLIDFVLRVEPYASTIIPLVATA